MLIYTFLLYIESSNVVFDCEGDRGGENDSLPTTIHSKLIQAEEPDHLESFSQNYFLENFLGKSGFVT